MNCDRCPALCKSRTRIVLPTPCQAGGLLAIGEAPGADEDAAGEGFVGRAGKTLDAVLLANGIGRDGYGRANIVRCRPEGNRKPTPQERDACLPLLIDFILECRPRVLLLVGQTPTGVFRGNGSLPGRIEETRRWSGSIIGENLCHPAVKRLAGRDFALAAVPMPHTSPLAWNRNAPDGRKWAEIGREQVAFAAGILRGS